MGHVYYYTKLPPGGGGRVGREGKQRGRGQKRRVSKNIPFPLPPPLLPLLLGMHTGATRGEGSFLLLPSDGGRRCFGGSRFKGPTRGMAVASHGDRCRRWSFCFCFVFYDPPTLSHWSPRLMEAAPSQMKHTAGRQIHKWLLVQELIMSK